MSRRSSRISVVLLVLYAMFAAVALPGATLQPAAGPQKVEALPLSWTCPMHPEIVEAEKGSCPVCKMDLVPVRLDAVFGCPVHSVVHERKAGKCPICRRDLVTVTVAVTWTCADRPEIDQLDRGKCPDGSAMIEKFTQRAHGNHNAQHGGSFFMAADNWHHLEGTLPENGVFRLYLYDDYTKPLPAAEVAAVRGAIVPKGLAPIPLTLAPSGQYFEAKASQLTPPADLAAKITLKPGGPEYHFDFTFPELSKDRASASLAASAAVDPSQIPVEIPDDPNAILGLLRTRDKQIKDFIQRGSFGDMYVPAFQAKDLALALDFRARDLPRPARVAAVPAIKRLVQSAWLLDAYGDLGNRDQISSAYSDFAEAMREIEAAFATPTPPRR